MKVSLSRVLPFEISVKFLYADRNAKGKLVVYCIVCTVSYIMGNYWAEINF